MHKGGQWGRMEHLHGNGGFHVQYGTKAVVQSLPYPCPGHLSRKSFVLARK